MAYIFTLSSTWSLLRYIYLDQNERHVLYTQYYGIQNYKYMQWPNYMWLCYSIFLYMHVLDNISYMHVQCLSCYILSVLQLYMHAISNFLIQKLKLAIYRFGKCNQLVIHAHKMTFLCSENLIHVYIPKYAWCMHACTLMYMWHNHRFHIWLKCRLIYRQITRIRSCTCS